MKKQCVDCLRMLKPDQFYKRPDSGKLRPNCISCFKSRNRKNHYKRKSGEKKKPESYRDYLRQQGMMEYYERTIRYM